MPFRPDSALCAKYWLWVLLGVQSRLFLPDVFAWCHTHVALEVTVKGTDGVEAGIKGDFSNIYSAVKLPAGALDAQTVDKIGKADVQTACKKVGNVVFAQG